jgi:uncharacterized membrane protein YoaK (UPF0700 family)
MKRSEVRHRVQNISLGFIAGYVDTLGFVALFGLFIGHITGNFVLIGAELSRPQSGPVLLKFLAFPSFILGVAFARIMIGALLKRDRHALVYAYWLQLLLLTGFMIAGVLSPPLAHDPNLMSAITGSIGAWAMGTHSCTSRLLLPNFAPTTMMTGNVTQLTIDAVDVLRGSADQTTKKRCVKFLWPVLAFGFGGIGAGFAYIYAGFYALCIPIVILLYLIYTERGVMRKKENHTRSPK